MRRTILVLLLTLAACGAPDYSEEVSEILEPASCDLGAQVLCFDFGRMCALGDRECLEIAQACMTEAVTHDEACRAGAGCSAECWADGFGCMAETDGSKPNAQVCQAEAQRCAGACI